MATKLATAREKMGLKIDMVNEYIQLTISIYQTRQEKKRWCEVGEKQTQQLATGTFLYDELKKRAHLTGDVHTPITSVDLGKGRVEQLLDPFRKTGSCRSYCIICSFEGIPERLCFLVDGKITFEGKPELAIGHYETSLDCERAIAEQNFNIFGDSLYDYTW